jgi:hypothetical protein
MQEVSRSQRFDIGHASLTFEEVVINDLGAKMLTGLEIYEEDRGALGHP